MIELKYIKKFNESFIKSLNGCWEWNRSIMKSGYGNATDGKQMSAHRLSYQIFKGDIPKDLQVMHSCDNRKCVNPEHLSLGTRKDNMKDCSNKNRLNPISKLNLQKKDKNNKCLKCNASLSDRRFNSKYCNKCIIEQKKLTHSRWQKANRDHLNKYKRELRKLSLI